MDPTETAALAQMSKSIVDAHPELVQPAAAEVGLGLGLAAKLIFHPLRMLDIRFSHTEEALRVSLAAKLDQIPPEHRVEADPMVTGPAMIAAGFVLHHEVLREMYANLLARAADARTKAAAHPSFVDIIRQLTPDEAHLIAYVAGNADDYFPVAEIRLEFGTRGQPSSGHFVVMPFATMAGVHAGCVCPERASIYLSNLERLGLIIIRDGGVTSVDPNAQLYQSATIFPGVPEAIEDAELHLPTPAKGSERAMFVPRHFFLSPFGRDFVRTCVAKDAPG